MRLAAAFLALAASGCSSPGTLPPDGGGDATDEGASCLFCSDATNDSPLQLQVKGKVDQICANQDGCHGGSAAGMTLVPGAEFDAMINVVSTENPPMLRVKPGDPAQSYVYVKLACDGGIPEGGCMPLGSPRNADQEKLAQLFHDWIEAGAPTQ